MNGRTSAWLLSAGLSAGVVCPILLGKDISLSLFPTVYAFSKEATGSEAVKEAIAEGVAETSSITSSLIKWFGQQLGVGSDLSATDSGSMMRELFIRGLVMVCAGAVLYGLREGSVATWDYLKKQLTLTVVFESQDQTYRWIMQWLADQPFTHSTHTLTVTNFDPVDHKAQEEEGALSYHPTFAPGEGTHWFSWRGHWIWMERTRVMRVNAYGNPLDGQQIRLTLFGKESARQVVSQLVQEALHHSIEKDRSKTVVYVGDQYANWNKTTVRPIRPMNSVILAEGVGEKLLADVKDYLGKENWYSVRGIPYRRGYLLYGSPGCGKTSFITALAGELKLHIYVLNLANENLSDETLASLMTSLPYRCILLFEDVDAAFASETSYESDSSDDGAGDGDVKGKAKSRSMESETLTNGITFSGLINTIDGVASQEGRLVFFTTNHYEKLSKTLLRPGRVDALVEIGLATKDQARRLFIRFYGHFEGEEEDRPIGVDVEQLAEEFASQVPEKAVSMAKLQGYLMQFKHDPLAAVKAVGELAVGM